MRRVAKAFAAFVPPLLLIACGNGGTDAGDDPFGSVPVVVIDSVANDGGAGESAVDGNDADDDANEDAADGNVPDGSGRTITVAGDQACSTIGEPFELAVTAPVDGSGEATRDVSASVSLTPSYSDALEVLSQGDGGISFRMNERDIVELRIEFDGGEASGKTLFFAGFTPDTPDSVLMRKRVLGGCLFALRMPEVRFCTATFAQERFGDAEPERFTLGSSGRFASFAGCDYELPDGVSFLELTDAETP